MTIRITGNKQRRRRSASSSPTGQGVSIGGNGVSAPTVAPRRQNQRGSKEGFPPLRGNETVVAQQGHVRMVAPGRRTQKKKPGNVTQVSAGPAQSPQVLEARARNRRPPLTLTAASPQAPQAAPEAAVAPGMQPYTPNPGAVVEAAEDIVDAEFEEEKPQLLPGSYYSDRLGRYVQPSEPDYDTAVAVKMGAL